MSLFFIYQIIRKIFNFSNVKFIKFCEKPPNEAQFYYFLSSPIKNIISPFFVVLNQENILFLAGAEHQCLLTGYRLKIRSLSTCRL